MGGNLDDIGNGIGKVVGSITSPINSIMSVVKPASDIYHGGASKMMSDPAGQLSNWKTLAQQLAVAPEAGTKPAGKKMDWGQIYDDYDQGMIRT